MTGIHRDLVAPFPWFGSKVLASDEVWRAFGDVKSYIEPFAGSLAVLLGRPKRRDTAVETVNDVDAWITNFWRALQNDPAGVAKYAGGPIHEADVKARHQWLMANPIREKMLSDPDFFDVKVAGWWVYGICTWVGNGWCNSDPTRGSIPNCGIGVGVQGIAVRADLRGYLEKLADRLKYVKVTCGDWARVLGASAVGPHTKQAYLTPVGIFLDPPYDSGDIKYAGGGQGTAQAAKEWAVAHGDRDYLRIALCGYVADYVMPEGWRCFEWKSGIGHTNAAKTRRECIWFSPHCDHKGGKLLSVGDLFR